MSIKKELDEIKKMSLEGFNDVEHLEKLLNYIVNNGDNSQIINICCALDDKIKHPSVGEDLVKAIFYIAEEHGLEEGMFEVAKSMPSMIPHGKEWATIINRMILDSDELIELYKDSIRKVDNSTQLIIYDILEYLKEDDFEYSKIVDELILECF
ncbi:Imm30 family immunity protein [Clostridium saccharoperbutylacetonicum]|uniref:Imm30 family immunity protein n=1 Tax=Clostridium saccharoperbutylacetonicum TaxID=36745 RepID=UPI0039EBD624